MSDWLSQSCFFGLHPVIWVIAAGSVTTRGDQSEGLAILLGVLLLVLPFWCVARAGRYSRAAAFALGPLVVAAGLCVMASIPVLWPPSRPSPRALDLREGVTLQVMTSAVEGMRFDDVLLTVVALVLLGYLVYAGLVLALVPRRRELWAPPRARP
jgi:hypothetical protein